ncbi:MAG: DUF6602 domain-containing protein [Pseudomonadota bacterium]
MEDNTAMEDYLFNRLKGDAAAAIEKSKAQEKVQHPGLRGRFREIVVSDLLRPWLPPFCGCGTGTIIDGRADDGRHSSQDDIIIYDTSLIPPILAGTGSEEGVFLYNGVLVRIEVKSTIRLADYRSFARSSVALASMKLANSSEHYQWNVTGALNLIFAFSSDLQSDSNKEFERFEKAFSECAGYQIGHVGAVCVVGEGLWQIKEHDGELRWQKVCTKDSSEQIAQFVAATSMSAYRQHLERRGMDYKKTLEAGISAYIKTSFEDP